MSAFQVVVRPQTGRSAPLAGLFDVVVDGVNVTARVGEAQSLAHLAELGHAVAALLSGRRPRATVQLYAEDEAWELGLERDGASTLVSVYRSGPRPEVAIVDRTVALPALRAGLLDAISAALSGRPSLAVRASLAAAQIALTNARDQDAAPVQRRHERVAPKADGFVLAAEAEFRHRRATRRDPRGSHIERADLHALLLEGTLEVGSRVRTVRLGGVQVFLAAEHLIHLAEEALEAWQLGRPTFRRVDLGGARFGVRRGPGDSPLAVTVSGGSIPGGGAQTDRGPITFPEVPTDRFVQVVVRFCVALAETFARHDGDQKRNLRLTALVQDARRLESHLEDAFANDSVTNPDPETYASFAPRRRDVTDGKGQWSAGGRMRFFPRWVATVPHIDLKSTMLCDDRLIVGSASETVCLSRGSGTVQWRLPTRRAASVLTPAGLARIHGDGRVNLHDLDSGELRFAAHVAPRQGGGASGAVVQAPGLPKLLVLAEGDASVTALDLVSGDVRWRHTARRPAAYRCRRAGKLLLVGGRDTALTALDVTTGDVVWRLRDRYPLSGEVTVDDDATFAIGGASSGPTRLHRLDPWRGSIDWTAELEDRPAPREAPMVAGDTVALVVRDRRGTGIVGCDRDTGEVRWRHEPGLCEGSTAWIATHDGFLANTATGTLTCLDAETGEVRYRHVFPGGPDADEPRQLRPTLQGGAAFVPQQEVQVLRPQDGELIGQLPCDLIADLLLVDDRCNVFVAEESGHIAAFGTAPRLSLVR